MDIAIRVTSLGFTWVPDHKRYQQNPATQIQRGPVPIGYSRGTGDKDHLPKEGDLWTRRETHKYRTSV